MDYLVHHGVKGMKWGVRRYQNPDGTLTDEGKKRYARNYVNFSTGVGLGAGAYGGGFLGAAVGTMAGGPIGAKIGAAAGAAAGGLAYGAYARSYGKSVASEVLKEKSPMTEKQLSAKLQSTLPPKRNEKT